MSIGVILRVWTKGGFCELPLVVIVVIIEAVHEFTGRNGNCNYKEVLSTIASVDHA